MRPEELVRRADEHVDAERGDIDRSVRGVVDGVGPGDRAGPVREIGDAADLGERAHRVGGDRKGDDPRPVGELPLQVVEVERRVLVDVDEADGQVAVVRELEPGRDVRVVVELRAQDLVARRGTPGRPCARARS